MSKLAFLTVTLVLGVGCGSSAGEDPVDTGGTSGDSALTTDGGADTAKADTTVATDSAGDGLATDTTTSDGAADTASSDATSSDTTAADTKADGTTTDVATDGDGGKPLGAECTLDGECVSGLKCCGGGAIGLPHHCRAPDPGTGSCPLVP